MEAVILCGGLGTRLRGVVDDLPKCLAPVSGKPFLEYLLDGLARSGFTRIVLSVGYLREKIFRFMESRSWPFDVDYAVEETPLGTGGGIRLALSRCLEDRIFVLNGDTYFHVDFSSMPWDAPVTLALKPMRRFNRYGTVVVEGERITAFREKAPCAEGLINGGVYALVRSRLDLSGFGDKFSFEKEVLEPFSARGMVGASVQDGYFIDIGIPDDYALAQRELPELQAVLSASERVMAASEADFLFLDRDGVINRLLRGDYVKTWEEFRFLPGVLEELRRWAGRYRRILLVTNQRGVGRGIMTREALEDIHEKMLAEIRRHGGRIDRVYVCTAVSDDDPRRKPHPGMFLEACADFPEIVPGRSLMLGDTPSDGAFAKACGMRFIQF